MKIASWMLEPLHWLKVTAVVVAWVLIAPTLWDVLRLVVATPGGGEVLFYAGGFMLVTVLASRRGRSRRAEAGGSSMSVAEMVNQISRTPQQLQHSARHEAAHAVVAWAQGAEVVSVDVIAEGAVGGATAIKVPERSLTEASWIALQNSLASTVIDDRTCPRSSGGCSSDVADAFTHVAVIIAIGDLPSGYVGPMTLEGLVVAATSQARAVLEEHQHLADAIAERLVAAPDKRWLHPDITGLHHALAAAEEEELVLS